MARKKREEGGGNNAPWLNTFADLMNLLLCFFVLLFALSDVNGEKFENISISMANSIGILQGGGTAIGEAGQLINSGMSQMSEVSEYFSTMGKSAKEQDEQSIENEGEYDPNDPLNSENSEKGDNGSQGENDTQGTEGENQTQGSQGTQGADGSGDVGIQEAMEKLHQEMAEVSSGMYDEVSDLTEKYNLGEFVELSIDPEYQFVQLTLKGSVLYDSGDADIKQEAKPILSKIGDILLKFEGYTVEITGHTDNVPMNSSTFRDNNWLSSARALNAAEFLIDECNIEPATLKYSGRGEYEPISSNATAEGRAKNRRIEIKIYNELSGK